MWNNKNIFKEILQRPDNSHSWSSPKISHELQKAQNINFRCQTASFSCGSTAVKSKSVTICTQAKQFLVIYLYSSSFFSASFAVLPGFYLFFPDMSSYYKPVPCAERKSFPLKYPLYLPPIFLVYQRAQVDWRMSLEHRDWWWWWWWWGLYWRSDLQLTRASSR